MQVLRFCGVLAVVLHFCSGIAPLPDDRLFINSDSINKAFGPIDSPKRKNNGTGVCFTVHEKENPTHPGKRYILRKQVTVPIIVDVQNDFSDDYPQSTLPVPGTKAVVTVINWIREQGEYWFGWKSSFAGVIRTEDTHPKDHFSFADSKYWEVNNMVPANVENYNKPVERAYYEFKLGCKVDDKEPKFQKLKVHQELLNNAKTNQTTAASHVPTSSSNQANKDSTGVEKTEDNYDMTLGIVKDASFDLNLYTVQPALGANPAEFYVTPNFRNIKMWLWPKHCVVGTDGHKSNKRLTIRETDIVVPKGYYTFRESLTGQVECDEEEEEEMLTLGQLVLQRTNLARYLDDMENPLVFRGPSRSKGLVIQNLIIVGFAFEYCVAATALSLASIKTESGILRYNVIIVTDGVGYLTPYNDTFRAGIRKKLGDAGVKFVDHQDLVFV